MRLDIASRLEMIGALIAPFVENVRMASTQGSAKARREFPVHQLDQAMVVAKAIAEQNAGKPMDRILVAKAIGRTPSSSEFRALLSSSLKYGLTIGTEKADRIELTELGTKVAKPMTPAEGRQALRDAALFPELLGRILRHYDQSQLPTGDFFLNSLERTFGVDAAHTQELAEILRKNAQTAGILEEIGSSHYVLLNREGSADSTRAGEEPSKPSGNDSGAFSEPKPTPPSQSRIVESDDEAEAAKLANRRVFISHGRNIEIVEQVKTLLSLADFEYEIAVESETTAVPVPEKVREGMRRCGAAIICVTPELTEDQKHPSINQNVLIEIGAAFVLYDKRVVLLWDKAVPVPSNLQGLYRCEINGGEISWTAGTKLLSVLKDLKTKK